MISDADASPAPSSERRLPFISVAAEDMAAAEWLAERLPLAGYQPWLELQFR